jgi:hypothetical protein
MELLQRQRHLYNKHKADGATTDDMTSFQVLTPSFITDTLCAIIEDSSNCASCILKYEDRKALLTDHEIADMMIALENAQLSCHKLKTTIFSIYKSCCNTS